MPYQYEDADGDIIEIAEPGDPGFVAAGEPSNDVGVETTRQKASTGEQFLAYFRERQRKQNEQFSEHPVKSVVSAVGNAAAPFSLGGLYRTVTGEKTSPGFLPDPTPAGMVKGATNAVLGPMRLAGQLENARPDWAPSPVNALTRLVTGDKNTTFNDSVTKPLIRKRNEIYDAHFNPSVTGEMAGEFLATGGALPAVAAASKSGLLMALLKGAGKGLGMGAAGAVALAPGSGTESDEQYWQDAGVRAFLGGATGMGIGGLSALGSPVLAKYINARTDPRRIPRPVSGAMPTTPSPIKKWFLPKEAANYESLARANDIPTDVSNLSGAPHTAQALAETLQQAKIGGISEEVAVRSNAATQRGVKLLKMLDTNAAMEPVSQLEAPTPSRAGMFERVKNSIAKLNPQSTRGEVAKAQANATLYNAKVWADHEAGAIAKEADALGPLDVDGAVKRIEAVKQAYIAKFGDKANGQVLASLDKTIDSIRGGKDKLTPMGILDSLGNDIMKVAEGEPPASFSRAKAVRSANNAELTRFTSGENALVSKEEAVPLAQANAILEEAMRSHVADRSPKLDARYGKFLEGYKNKVVPFKDPRVAAALKEDALPQEVYGRLMGSLPEGQGGPAALRRLGGPKLQKTLSAEWFDDVLRSSGAGSPEGGGRAIPSISDAHGLQNQINPRKAVDRVQATLRNYRNLIPENEPAGAILDGYFKVISRMPEIAKGASSKLQWTDIWLRAPLTLAKKLVTTEGGKAFLLASSKFKDQASFDKFVSQNLPAVIGGLSSTEKLKSLLGQPQENR